MYIKDVNLIRTFWAVTQTESFSRAAKLLDSTQPTVTRQIQALEQETGLHLFDRSNKGLVITDAGKRLVESAGYFMDNVNLFSLQAAGQEDVLRGEIRITANEIIGIYLLPPAIKALREKYPEVQVELDISNDNISLTQRDADIAFRMQAPTQANLVGRRLPSLPLGFFGHKDLVAEHPKIDSMHDLLSLPLIGFDRTNAMVDVLNSMGIDAKRESFDLRCDNLNAQIALIRSGAGFGVMQNQLAACYPELEPVFPGWTIPDLDFWLLCHQDIQHSKTIRLMMQFFGEWFSDEPYKTALI